MPRMTKQEISDWNKLYDYVKKEILNYDNSIKVPNYLVMRLKGLLDGKFIANNNTNAHGKYTYDIILTTCKICKPKIRNYITQNSAKINDEKHLCNIIMMFIEQEINDVTKRLKEKEKSEQIISDMELPETSNNKSGYKTSEHKENKKLSNLW